MSTLRVNNITDASGGSSSLSVPGAAKAWVNFNGTGTVAIRAQMNVSSITDNAVGEYTVNFTTALADANYSVSGALGFQGFFLALNDNGSGANSAPTTSALKLRTCTSGGTNTDVTYVNVSIFR